MNILSELQWRGLIHQQTEGLDRLLSTPQVVYLGIDPTADSLHVGHLLALTTLKRFQKAGHTIIPLVGGATAAIGDPSGKSEERNLLEWEIVEKNIAAVKAQLKKLLDGETKVTVPNNQDWVGNFSYLQVLRTIGKHFPVNVMLTKDSVKSRMENGLSYTEFSYMLLQAYDFVHLHEFANCTLQIGGSDQWGNITAGIDLARRMSGVQLHGLTIPLLTKSDGTKMGKTESGALWLDAEKTSPYEFYQYWLNVADEDVERCLKFFTDLDADEINCLIQRHRSDPGQRIAQRRLAESLTKGVHDGTARLALTASGASALTPIGA